LLKYWTQLNNKPHWQTYIQTLYAVVNKGLGDFTQSFGTDLLMLDNYITQYSDVNTFFLPNDPLTWPKDFDFYADSIRLSNNLYNYYNQLTNGTEMEEVNQRLFA
jgi:hypothetical protein